MKTKTEMKTVRLVGHLDWWNNLVDARLQQAKERLERKWYLTVKGI